MRELAEENRILKEIEELNNQAMRECRQERPGNENPKSILRKPPASAASNRTHQTHAESEAEHRIIKENPKRSYT
jgi:hypothetical protein